MVPCQVVIDTNVVFSALHSNQGASHKLLSLVGISDRFQNNVSVPLVLEYEDVLKRESENLGLTHQEIDHVSLSSNLSACRRAFSRLGRNTFFTQSL